MVQGGEAMDEVDFDTYWSISKCGNIKNDCI
jgi:hypothetical protein